MSGYTEVVRAIRVWLHVNDRPGTSASDVDHAGPSSSQRSRANSGASSTFATSEGDMSASRKGKERATSMVSVASEKARLFRTSLENGFRGGGRQSPITSNSPTFQATGLPSDDSSTPSARPSVSMTPNGDNPSSELPPPFSPSPVSSPLDEGGQSLANGHLTTPVPDPDSPGCPPLDGPSPVVTPSDGPSPSASFSTPHRSSRRPSLPSILEKAAHPGVAFRTAMRKAEKDSSPSIVESDQTSSSGILSRGRSRTAETLKRSKSQKRALLGLFRRGQSPRSRSPSPPMKVETAPRPATAEQLEESIARLKRASMDPEMMQMAMDVVQLGDQLEAAAAISAPVTKTRFFDEPTSPSSYSVSSDRQAPKMPPQPTIERAWEHRRSRNGAGGVISPSPLANTWGEESDEEQPRRAAVRRSVTEVVRKSKDAPRRMPSLPAMAGNVRRRSRIVPSDATPPTDASAEPTSDSASFVDSTNSTPFTAETSPAANTVAKFEDVSAVPAAEDMSKPEEVPRTEEVAKPEEVLQPEDAPKADEEDEDDDPDRTITGPPATTDVPSLMLEEIDDGAKPDAVGPLPPLMDSGTHLPPETDTDRRRFRGESVSSQLTDSVVTPPSSRVLTPPAGSGGQRDRAGSDVDLRSLGLLPLSPESKAKRRSGSSKMSSMSTLGSGLPSERMVPSPLPSERPLGSQRTPPKRSTSQRSSSQRSTVHSTTSNRSTSQRSSTFDGPIPEGRPMRALMERKISSHAEARDAMEQDERDVLSIAQMPHSELSNRSLADQLAAYGASHALAQEYARVERMSSASSGSDRRFQRHSTMSTVSTNTSLSGADARRRSSISSFASSKAGMPMDPSISRIYDRRADGYRERMQSLVSAQTMNGLHKRSLTSASVSRSRATSASDMWLTAGPKASAAHQPRRLTDPTGSQPEEIDQHPHISGPLPMVSDLGNGRPRKNSANGSTRLSPISSIKTNGLPPTSAPRASPHGSVLSTASRRNGGANLSRASSLSTNAEGHPVRYQGLAQARAFAAQSSSYAAHSSSLMATSSIMASRQPHPRSDSEQDDSEDADHEPPFNVVQVGEWQNGLAHGKGHKKWGQFKDAIGHLRR